MSTVLHQSAPRWTAVISPCGTWRYELERLWDVDLPVLVICMLNPSRADAKVNDPTVAALTHFATSWGYGGFRIVNLYAFRAPKPKTMWMAPEAMRVGPENGAHLQSAIEYARAHGAKLLVAWGCGGEIGERDLWFINRAISQGVSLICLGQTKGGHPKHPAARGKQRIPRDLQPQPYREAL